MEEVDEWRAKVLAGEGRLREERVRGEGVGSRYSQNLYELGQAE